MRKVFTDDTNYWMTMFGEDIFYLTYLDKSELDLDKVKEVKEKGFELHGKKIDLFSYRP
jgi:hypothetical protein